MISIQVSLHEEADVPRRENRHDLFVCTFLASQLDVNVVAADSVSSALASAVINEYSLAHKLEASSASMLALDIWPLRSS